MNAGEKIPVELVVTTFLTTVPTHLQIVRGETTDTEAISNATLVNITVALFLFFLAGHLPDSNEENITKMRRAFQAAWLWVGKIGGDENRAREWFELFNSSLVNSGLLISDPLSRMAIALWVLKNKFPSSCDAESALEILPHLVLFGPMKTIESISIT